MRWIEIVHFMGCLGIAVATGVTAAIAGEPRLNQIQVIGTHNSYHIAPAPAIYDLVASAGRRRAEGLDYSHRPLKEQLSQLGIRELELDVYADPKGGLYAEPHLRKMVKNRGKDPGPDPAADGKLRKPGFKVLHVQDVDFRTHTPLFIDALKQIRSWSRANRRHLPITIMIELKDDAFFGLSTKPIKFGRTEVDEVDAAILSVFDRSEILTPDRMRGHFATLPEAIRSQGWPTLNAVRGLVMFTLENEDDLRDHYLDGHKGLQGRLMFATVAPTDPAAAWFNINDPIKEFDRIQKLVRDGFLVRTRADVDTVQARANDTTQRDKALASGAQFISTDYPEPDKRLTDYCVRLPGGAIARPNPVVGDALSKDVDLETNKPISAASKRHKSK
jgi:Phosphoinositide phospholipase C, Ca2+-dependent